MLWLQYNATLEIPWKVKVLLLVFSGLFFEGTAEGFVRQTFIVIADTPTTDPVYVVIQLAVSWAWGRQKAGFTVLPDNGI